MFLIVGLGNPGGEYENTRHNTGRMIVEAFRKKQEFSDWALDKKRKALVSSGKIGKKDIMLLLPETFMNKSGLSLKNLVTSVKKAHDLIVVYDDLDLPLGKIKISFNRGSGGHKGIESVARTLKTKEFYRLRIGASPQTPSGKLKKPSGEKAVVDFILGKFSEAEVNEFKKVIKKTNEAIELMATEGYSIVAGKVNSN